MPHRPPERPADTRPTTLQNLTPNGATKGNGSDRVQLKIKDFLTKYGFNGVWLGYQRLDMMNRIAKGHRDVCNDQESRILLALYDETVAGLDQLPELERTILTRQYIKGEYQPTIRDGLGLKSSA